MNDQITVLDGSVVHHGTANDRAYLMKLGGDAAAAAGKLEKLARTRGYSKIVAKIPARARSPFSFAGYRVEGAVPRYFRGAETAFFVAKYLQGSRRHPADPEKVSKVLAAARSRKPRRVAVPLEGCTSRMARPEDVGEMAALYRRIFASYPFPIQDPEYLRRTMADNVVYFGIWERGELLALASAEMDRDARSAEMTDFATLPEARGKGLATALLAEMEGEMRRREMATLYTIARAVSFGMNMTFAKLGYRYGGTLTRNTQISGSLECMNLWFRRV